MTLVKTEKGLCRLDPGMPRGAYISPEELEEALGIDRKSPKYAFATMGIISDFWRATVEAGDPKMARMEKYGIQVMSDEEAACYTEDRFWEMLMRAIAVHEKGARAIRESELTPEQLAEHQRSTLERGVVVSTVRPAVEAKALHEMQRAAKFSAFACAPEFDPFGEKG